jgi:hypothetical protein
MRSVRLQNSLLKLPIYPVNGGKILDAFVVWQTSLVRVFLIQNPQFYCASVLLSHCIGLAN